jgi:quercetin dioxygenase-like cupin family protein
MKTTGNIMKSPGMMSGILSLAVAALAGPARAEDNPPAGEHTALSPNAIKWGDAPPVFNKGAKMAVLYGDPSKPGLFIVRLKMPANYKVMPHTHPTDENITVVSGAFAAGMGDKLDSKVKAMPAGSFISMPAKMHHFAFSTEETIVEVSAMGPFAITYVDPKDDPSKGGASPAR